MTNKLSVVVTTSNRYTDLLSCIDSILTSDFHDIFWELIIVDDASSDKTATLSENTFANKAVSLTKVKIVHLSERVMMVKARNIGLAESSGEYILFVDDDNIVDKNLIVTLIGFVKTHKDAGIVGPAMYYRDGTKYMDYQKINLYTGKTSGIVCKSQGDGFFESDGIPNVFMITSAVKEKCGSFDETLMQTFTEPDYSFTAKKFGYRTYIVTSAHTYHQIDKKDLITSKMLGGKFAQKAYCLMRNRTIIEARYGSTLQKTIYLVFFSWFWPLIYSLLMLREGRFDLIKLYWLGWYDGLIYFFSGKVILSARLKIE